MSGCTVLMLGLSLMMGGLEKFKPLDSNPVKVECEEKVSKKVITLKASGKVSLRRPGASDRKPEGGRGEVGRLEEVGKDGDTANHHERLNQIARECLECDELRWAVICEYYGWLTSHYPADKVGGSTGMVIINGKNCTPCGAGTASATFLGTDNKEYRFAHARHSSCKHASEHFHDAQYYLFFTPEGRLLQEQYREEIEELKRLNEGRKQQKPAGEGKEYSALASDQIIQECLECDELRWAVICEYYGWLTSHYPADKVGGSTGMVIINGKNCTPCGAGASSATFLGTDNKEYRFAHARHSSCKHASDYFHNAQYHLFFTPEGQMLQEQYREEIEELKRLNEGRKQQKPAGNGKEFSELTSDQIIQECLECDELRWAVICEYKGWLSSHYPADEEGGSTGMVIINGKNCTPCGAGTASAFFIGPDNKEYNFAHARHSSCKHASKHFHNAQYHLFFTPDGRRLQSEYAREIQQLRKLNANKKKQQRKRDSSKRRNSNNRRR